MFLPFGTEPGSRASTESSSRSRRSWTSCRTTVATNAFVRLPARNRPLTGTVRVVSCSANPLTPRHTPRSSRTSANAARAPPFTTSSRWLCNPARPVSADAATAETCVTSSVNADAASTALNIRFITTPVSTRRCPTRAWHPTSGLPIREAPTFPRAEQQGESIFASTNTGDSQGRGTPLPRADSVWATEKRIAHMSLRSVSRRQRSRHPIP